ncbi:MAG: hypothetical protein SF069_08470 [Phycisphaerae bacterium]|nr:hypothetical protein [Phycisphaerae bacterium]
MFAILIALSSVVCGCRGPDRSSPDAYDRGLIYLFPGIEGGPWQMKQPAAAFRAAGVVAAIEVHDWSKLNWFDNLSNLPANLEAAKRIATRVADYARGNPGKPVQLVGYSGGGGLALMVVEALPADVMIDNVVLVQAAISPRFPLDTALSRLRGRLVNIYCESDWFTLGVGTSIMGTMDREFTPSAGKDGLDLSIAVRDPALRARVIQQGWTTAALRAGHLGGHLDMIGYEFNRRLVAPWVMASP